MHREYGRLTNKPSAVLAGGVEHERMHQDHVAFLASHLVEAAVRGILDRVDEILKTAQCLVGVGVAWRHPGRHTFGVIVQVFAHLLWTFIADPSGSAVFFDITPAWNDKECLLGRVQKVHCGRVSLVTTR